MVPLRPEGAPDPRDIAAALSAEVGAATIDEMLDLMAKQIMQIDRVDSRRGLPGAYKNATPNARGLFHTAAIKLAARADQLRRG